MDENQVPVFSGYQPEQNNQKTLGDRFRGSFAELLEFVAIILVLWVIIHYFIAEPHQVSGSSMFPNFKDHDLIITNKLPNHFGEYVRGEVIVFQNPRDASEDYIKRVIGMPGEKLKIMNGHVYINDELLPEPYLGSDVITQTRGFMSEGEEVVVPGDSLFVMGDNRPGSSDSREWGPLKKDLIIGQAWVRYWPFNKFQILEIGQAYKQN